MVSIWQDAMRFQMRDGLLGLALIAGISCMAALQVSVESQTKGTANVLTEVGPQAPMMMFTNSFDFPDRKYEFHGGAAWTPEAIGDSMETSFGRALLICGQREFYVAGQRVDAGVGVWIPHSPRSKQIAQCVAEYVPYDFDAVIGLKKDWFP